MAFTIKWSETAFKDLREIVHYIALDNPEAAAKLASRIISHIELASEHPYSNRIVPEKNDEAIREVILKPYRVIYSIDNSSKTIHVLRVWHSYRGIPYLE
jgi:toxin ParE1/3/4